MPVSTSIQASPLAAGYERTQRAAASTACSARREPSFYTPTRLGGVPCEINEDRGIPFDVLDTHWMPVDVVRSRAIADQKRVRAITDLQRHTCLRHPLQRAVVVFLHSAPTHRISHTHRSPSLSTKLFNTFQSTPKIRRMARSTRNVRGELETARAHIRNTRWNGGTNRILILTHYGNLRPYIPAERCSIRSSHASRSLHR